MCKIFEKKTTNEPRKASINLVFVKIIKLYRKHVHRIIINTIEEVLTEKVFYSAVFEGIEVAFDNF